MNNQEVVQGLFESLRSEKNKNTIPSSAFLMGDDASVRDILLEQYTESNRPIEGQMHMPIFKYKIQNPSNISNFLADMCKELGVAISEMELSDQHVKNYHRNATFRETFHRVLLLIETAGVELVIFDVVIPNEKQPRRLQDIWLADFFKEFIDEVQLPVVLAGDAWVEKFIGSHSQLNYRISHRIKLRKQDELVT